MRNDVTASRHSPTLDLHHTLLAATKGQGVASVSVISSPGTAPDTSWVPTSGEEPAFLAYSITKIFTAALILTFCEDGHLSLDDHLARWFPKIADADRISLRRLLNHTAGIPDYGGVYAYHQGVRMSPSTPWSFERFAAETLENGLLFAPGQGWEYSNVGYMLLKRIIEQVGGATFGEIISERIARRLGLERTFVAESIEDLASLAAGMSSELDPDGVPRDVRAYYHPGWVSHGVLASTSSEIVRFLDALFGGKLLVPGSVEQMMELVAVSIDEGSTGNGPLRAGRPSYGLGVMADPDSPWGLIAGHNGGGPCYSASAFHAFDLGGVSVCAMGAIEREFSAEGVVAHVLDHSSLKASA